MWFRADADIDIYVIPDAARCRAADMSVLEMDCCPLQKFDEKGDECWPCMCGEYTEDGTLENNQLSRDITGIF